MITELLNKAIKEVARTRFTITEFQLGIEPMEIFVSEANNIMGDYGQKAGAITTFMDIPVNPHPSKDAVMYCISIRNKPFVL